MKVHPLGVSAGSFENMRILSGSECSPESVRPSPGQSFFCPRDAWTLGGFPQEQLAPKRVNRSPDPPLL